MAAREPSVWAWQRTQVRCRRVAVIRPTFYIQDTHLPLLVGWPLRSSAGGGGGRAGRTV